MTFVCFVVVGFFEGFPKPSIFLANINKQIVKSQNCQALVQVRVPTDPKSNKSPPKRGKKKDLDLWLTLFSRNPCKSRKGLTLPTVSLVSISNHLLTITQFNNLMSVRGSGLHLHSANYVFPAELLW